MKNLIELYTSFCASVGAPVDGQGFVSTILPGSEASKPFMIDSKRLVLPIPEQLQQPDFSHRIGFHPLLQNIAAGDSRVLEKFRDRMNGYADFMFGMLLIDIAELSRKEKTHKDLSPEQAQYLGPFSSADEKFCKLLTSLVSTKRISKKNFEFIRFSVIKGRSYQGQKRTRVAVLHFPLYEQLPKDGKGTVILGHKLRGDDVKMLRKMYEFLFDGINTPEAWEFGTDSPTGPSMVALMTLYGKFTEVHNRAVSTLSSAINTCEELLIVNDWREGVDNIAHYVEEIRRIPCLEGNTSAERLTTANAPQRINETALVAPTRVDQAPVLTPVAAQQIQQTQQLHHQQQEQAKMQEPRPIRKLGVAAPTVQHATHQIVDTPQPQAGLSYQRPGMSVGAIYTEPQQQQQSVGHQHTFQSNTQFIQTPVQQAPAQPQVTKLPDTARYYNGQIYIPIETNGVSALPANGVMIENKVYVPIAAAVNPVQNQFAPQGQSVLNNGQFNGMHQQITHPSQVPGLSAAEIQAFEANPVMFQNYLATLQNTGNQLMQQAVVQRQQAIPGYLQRTLERHQQQQQQQTQLGFFRR